MPCPLHSQILEALGDRESWENRQRIWYQMRHDGLPRKRKPYPGAANLHFPLIDTTIEKLKPFYHNMVYQRETLANFVAKRAQRLELSVAAAEYFDHQLKEHTNWQDELPVAIDVMLMRNRGVIKTWWDPIKSKLCFESMDPLFLVLPSGANEPDDADWIVHVKHITVAQYKRDKRYDREPSLVAKIAGGEDEAGGQYDDERKQREGLTFLRDKNRIVIWEVYERTSGGWTVYTYAPNAPDRYLRKPFGLTLKLDGEVVQPFVSLPFEIKDKGWLAPRGVAERMAPFEAWLCKTWNSKADNMDFTTAPLFTTQSGQQAPSLQKYQIRPGEVIPGIQKLDFGSPSTSLDQEMINTRMIAEQSISMPDVGIGNALNTRESKTATEVEQIGALMSQGIEMRGSTFRYRIAQIYKRAWALLVQHKKNELQYLFAGELKVLPAQALHDLYQIIPSGSPDQWQPERRRQRAYGRYQQLVNNPYVDQEELTRLLIEADDPQLVKRLYRPAGLNDAKEAEDEAIEIGALLMQGYPAQALPHENHMVRIKILIGKVQQLAQLNAPVDPVAQQRLMEHLGQHIQFLQEQNPQAAREVRMAIEAMMEGAQPQ